MSANFKQSFKCPSAMHVPEQDGTQGVAMDQHCSCHSVDMFWAAMYMRFQPFPPASNLDCAADQFCSLW